MIAKLGATVSRVFERTAPDPFVLAVLLTAVAFALALAFGSFPAGETARATALLDAWRGESGLWRFLAFAMQMCLILVTGHALAESRPVRRLIGNLAGRPRGAGSAAVLVGLSACAFGLINWGLGLIVGALLAREVGRSLEARGVRAHYPLLAGAGYMGMLIWHGGLSGSAPLTMTTRSGAEKVMPAAVLERFPEGVPLGETIFSPLNLVATAGLLVIVPVVLRMLTPGSSQAVRTIACYRADDDEAGASGRRVERALSLPDRLLHGRWVAWGLGLALVAGIARFGSVEGVGRIGLNEVNGAMLGLGLLLHGSLGSYVRAAEAGARGCVGIMLQFPLYAGIMAMLVTSGLIENFARALASMGGASTIPLMTYLSAGVVNLFVPSGGGQWAIQGPIALEAGASAGLAPGKMIMAVAYGDQLTNMLQPFWALPLLAITGVKAREIVGYTGVVMLAAGVWLGLVLLVF